jgi:protein-tyrosine-phosphatase
MNIHFVCAGNTYRSRLAETYLNSLQLPAVKVSSSGTIAAENLNGPISWLTAWVIKKHSLVPFMSSHWHQTTAETLEAADKVIFMDAATYETCQSQFNYRGTNYEVWDIKDVGDFQLPQSTPQVTGETENMAKAEATFELIKTKVDTLVAKL